EVGALQASVSSVLAQTFHDIELLIIDDGSDVVQEPLLNASLNDPRIEILRHERNRGAAAARNTGIRRAKGTYIAFLDCDDTWHPEKLEHQLEYMQRSKDRPSVSCTAFQIITPFRPEGEVRRPKPSVEFQDLLWGCSISPG